MKMKLIELPNKNFGQEMVLLFPSLFCGLIRDSFFYCKEGTTLFNYETPGGIINYSAEYKKLRLDVVFSKWVNSMI